MLKELLEADKLRFGKRGSESKYPYIISTRHTFSGEDTWKVVAVADERSVLADWGINCRLADLEAQTRLLRFLSGRAAFSYDLVGDILYGWLRKPDLYLSYDDVCPLGGGGGKVLGGIKGGNGARILKGGATSDLVRALNKDRQGVYRIWALEYEPQADWILQRLAEVVKEAKSAEEQVLLLETKMSSL